MKEAEAKTKWCPFARRVAYGSAADSAEIAEQGIDPDYSAEMAARFPCIASACMAWQWRHRPTETTTDFAPGRKMQVGGDGYCGLAGNK